MDDLLKDFKKVLELSGIDSEICIVKQEVSLAPHHKHVPKWREGFMAIYVFKYRGQVLKIGKAGSKSKARFTTQHYSVKAAKSTLATSLINDKEFVRPAPYNDKEKIGEWIKEHTERISLFIDAKHGDFVLNLLEAFLHCRLQPKYEGFKSQRAIS